MGLLHGQTERFSSSVHCQNAEDQPVPTPREILQAVKANVEWTPAVTPIVINEPTTERRSCVCQTQTDVVSTFLTVVATKLAKKKQATLPYLCDKTKAAEFTVDVADGVAQTVALLPSVLEKRSQTSHTFSQIGERPRLHSELLNVLFGRFVLDPGSLNRLDEVLSSLNRALRKSVEPSESGLKHTLLVYQDEPDCMGGVSKHLHVMYVSMDKKSWTDSAKNSGKEHVLLRTQYLHQEFVINTGCLKAGLDRMVREAEIDTGEQMDILRTLSRTVELERKQVDQPIRFSKPYCGSHGVSEASVC